MPPTIPPTPSGRLLSEFMPLLPAEEILRKACRTGQVARLGNERPEKKTAGNHIRPAVLRVFCLGLDHDAPVYERGVIVLGAWVAGEYGGFDDDFDLSGCNIPRPMWILSTHFAGTVVAFDAITNQMSLDGSFCREILADRLICNGDFSLRRKFEASKGVSIAGSTIRGDFSCVDSFFSSNRGSALSFDGAEIGGSVLLKGKFRAEGEVRFLGATIKGNLECTDATFAAGEGEALSFDDAEIGGNVFLTRTLCVGGAVRFPAATIGGDLACTDATFVASKGDALSFDGAEIVGGVVLQGTFRAEGSVHFRGATVGGDLTCTDATFAPTKGDALSFDSAKISGNVFLNGQFRAEGLVRLLGSSVGGNFECQGGHFASLNLQRVEVGDTAIFVNGFHASGTVDFQASELTILVDDEGAWQGATLLLDGLTLKRFAGGAPTNAPARIRWLDRQPTDHLDEDFRPQPWEECARVLAEMGHEQEANLIRIEKRRRMRWLPWKRATSDLGQVAALPGVVFDWILDKTIGYGWAAKRPLYWLLVLWLAAGAFYSAIAPHGVMTPTDPKVFLAPSIPPECRVDWIGFSGPRPPLADDAARRETEATKRDLPAAAPWSEICPRAMPSEYSTFSPFAYALDVLLPIVDLRQERDWAPRVADQTGRSLLPNMENDPSGWGYGARFVEWALILSGWALSALLLGAVTGVIRRD